MLFDTHAHYDDRKFNEDRQALLAALPENGVGLMVNAGCDLPTSRFGMGLADQYPHVYFTVGVHPHSAKELEKSHLDELRKLAAHKKAVAIGEIGLDYYYDNSPREVQKERFIWQMELAQELGLPVVIHDRDAHGDCMDIIRAFPRVRGVFHCYAGSAEMARELIKLGYMLSFTGAITFANAKKAIEVIEQTDLCYMMIETDSPYLTPEPFRGKRNDSRLVRLVAEKIAQIKNVPFDMVAQITTENGKRLFGIV